MKAIHVKLADERGIVVVLEKLGNELVGEAVFVEDDKRVAIISPSNKVCVS